MSFEALRWATGCAPVADVNEFAVLAVLAEKAGPDGCNAYPSRPTIAERARVDDRTVLRSLQRMEARGLIARGDQQAAAYIRADRRPVVYDLMIPAVWFADGIDRVNAHRQKTGRPPLTAVTRPDLPDRPDRTARSDKGRKRPAKGGPRGDSQSSGAADDGVTGRHPDPGPRGRSRGDSQPPRGPGHGVTDGHPGRPQPQPHDPSGPGGRGDSQRLGGGVHGVSLSPARGDSQSATGCLTDTQIGSVTQSRTGEEAPAARSVADARRASAGSSAYGRASGCAASADAGAPDPSPRPFTDTQQPAPAPQQPDVPRAGARPPAAPAALPAQQQQRPPADYAPPVPV
ncbi:helix-turn-helix domain-containing protein [Streptomyces sp. NBC_01565]|uniref:helix-turn-helix domain-containing protein n=1 Tax=Streptomyces sp. NBC_01565 TaxID=2975881 RepID=UPI002259EB01|nr:helix-turn-helix domain-containing protein [Streptomyces sp. NBC_01565]MCX4547224.1 helix-turn-helix domain-containing protein [Streptomyces sp. NBC_01565]